jgi:hypothetical protein
LGGVGGSGLLGMLMNSGAADAAAGAASSGFNISSILGSGVGGLVLQVVVGMIKSAMNKTA